jgi:hypothetical protein
MSRRPADPGFLPESDSLIRKPAALGFDGVSNNECVSRELVLQDALSEKMAPEDEVRRI